jgi:NADPH:quinone reductase-like Zn-dependent oxidoreductase
MKAAIIQRYGSADLLQTWDIPTPIPAEGEVLVHVRASPVTAGDLRLRAADFPTWTVVPGRLMMGVFRPKHQVQGTMFAGRVAAVGSGVSQFQVGDNVFGSTSHGAYAEYLTVPESGAMALIPDGVSYEDAAAVPYGGWTALHFLRNLANVQPGQSVLILGASGGVGRFAVQLAKHMGAVVTGVCSADNLALVRELGADHVIDYRAEDFAGNGRHYDVIFDIAGVGSFGRSRKSLTSTGRYLTLFVSFTVLFQMAWTALRGGQKALFDVAMGKQSDMRELGDLLDQGAIRPVVAHRLPLDRIAEAHATAESGRLQGSVLVTIPVS